MIKPKNLPAPKATTARSRRQIAPWLQWVISLGLGILSMFMLSGLTQLSGSSDGSALSLTLVPGLIVLFFTRQWRTAAWWTIPMFLLVVSNYDYSIAVLVVAWTILFRWGVFLHNPQFDQSTGKFLRRSKE